MKKFLLLLFSLFLISGSAQTSIVNEAINNLQNKLDSVEIELKRQGIHIENSSEKISLIDKQNEFLRDGLIVNESIFNGLSNYFTLISIFLTIVIIALPVINYFLVWQPNKKMKEQLEKLETDLQKTRKDIPNKIDRDFESFLDSFEKRKAKELLQTLQTENPDLSKISNFFFLSNFTDFDDEDQELVKDYLEKYTDLSANDRMILNGILKKRSSLISEKYYKRTIEKGDVHEDYQNAVEYLVKNGADENINYWEMVFKSNSEPEKLLIKIIKVIFNDFIGRPKIQWFDGKEVSFLDDKKNMNQQRFGKEILSLFINNENIIKKLDKEKFLKEDEKEEYINRVIKDYEFFKESLFYKTVFEDTTD